CLFLQAETEKAEEPEGHQSYKNERYTEATKRTGNVGVLHFFTYARERNDRKHPSDTGTKPIGCRLRQCVRALDHKQCSSKDRAIHRDKRKEYTKCTVQRG